jgi:hypothetical protein
MLKIAAIRVAEEIRLKCIRKTSLGDAEPCATTARTVLRPDRQRLATS